MEQLLSFQLASPPLRPEASTYLSSWPYATSNLSRLAIRQ